MSGTINPFGKEIVQVAAQFCGRELKLETGRLAFQAGGAVLATYGDTVVLATATVAPKPIEGIDFFPLSVEYEERMYAAGKISGSRFIKREGRPSEDAILAARLIDRPIRPLFPKGYRQEIQVINTILSLDPQYKPDTIAMIASSAALMLCGVPFAGPVGGVRVGLIDGKIVAYPITAELAKSQLDLTVAATEQAIMMVEAGAKEVSEAEIVKALEAAHQAIQPCLKMQHQLVAKHQIKQQPFKLEIPTDEVIKEVNDYLKGKLGADIRDPQKDRYSEKVQALKDQTVAHFQEKIGSDGDAAPYGEAYEMAIKKEVRRMILEEGIRPDERQPEEIRPISAEVAVLPRTHGSALFTRGSTQALNVTTLAPLSYAQVIDTMEQDTENHFLHHYNMPGYTVGEVRRMGSPGRREIGHGKLAERALSAVLPSIEDFPYTIRSVSEIMSSNGSTSMASVCSGTLSLMDAGVPISRPVSGIAMGLISEGSKAVILSDIQGVEDFSGDMDFKVAGTSQGVTALQMDIKIGGIPMPLLAQALEQAKSGRQQILEAMLKVLAVPRLEISKYAPRVESITVNPDKVREIIGKGGEMINKIIEATGTEIDIRDGGLVMVSAVDKSSIDKAIEWIRGIVAEPEVGKTYEGKVVKIMDFGAFVQILPGIDGLVHVSAMQEGHVKHPKDVVKEGDVVRVKLLAIDDRGRLVLSMKEADK